MRKWLMIALLAFYVGDVGVDMFGFGGHEQTACQPCQTSVCQTHVGAPSSSSVQLPIPTQSWRVGGQDAPLLSQLFVKFFFHPPRLAA